MKFKHYSLIIWLTFSLVSCKQDAEKNVEEIKIKELEIPELSNKVLSEKKPRVEVASPKFSLANQAFISGSSSDFMKNHCSFYFECDCCSSQILFEKDGTFFFMGVCVGERYACKGTYETLENSIRLNYSGMKWVQYFDESVDAISDKPLFRRDDFKAQSSELVVDSCNGNLLLKFSNSPSSEMAIHQENSYKSIKEDYQDLIEKFE